MSQFVKMDELLDPENGFVVKDTVVVACEVLDCCPWFDENKLTYPDAEGPDAGQRAEGHADGARDDRAAAAAVEALTQTLSSAGLGDAGVAREFGRILAGAENLGAGEPRRARVGGGGGRECLLEKKSGAGRRSAAPSPTCSAWGAWAWTRSRERGFWTRTRPFSAPARVGLNRNPRVCDRRSPSRCARTTCCAPL